MSASSASLCAGGKLGEKEAEAKWAGVKLGGRRELFVKV